MPAERAGSAFLTFLSLKKKKEKENRNLSCREEQTWTQWEKVTVE